MRNRILTIIILISIALLCFAIFYGIDIGKIRILSIEQLKEKNKTSITKIDEAEKLSNEDYPKSVEKLEKSFSEYLTQKKKYEQLSGLSEEEILEIYETKQYDISYLWRILGNYAKERGVSLSMDVQSASKVNSSYNYDFKVSGAYADIIYFIKDLENDSDLYFRIYNFKMSGSGTVVNASFKVENVNVDPSTIKGGQQSATNLFK